MRKIGVRDPRGTRWTVRARQLRGTRTAGPMSVPEQDSLRRRLTAALSPHPAPVADPLRGTPDAWLAPGDSADIALRQARWDHRHAMDGYDAGIFALVGLVRLVIDAIGDVRIPKNGTWQLEALARGRIRRWARWEVQGAEAAERTAAAVTAALASGRIPEPVDAQLVEVVDQRPPSAPVRSAGLGGNRTTG